MMSQSKYEKPDICTAHGSLSKATVVTVVDAEKPAALRARRPTTYDCPVWNFGLVTDSTCTPLVGVLHQWSTVESLSV